MEQQDRHMMLDSPKLNLDEQIHQIKVRGTGAKFIK